MFNWYDRRIQVKDGRVSSDLKARARARLTVGPYIGSISATSPPATCFLFNQISWYALVLGNRCSESPTENL